MPNFELPPAPPSPGTPESEKTPESKGQQAKSAMMRLARFMNRWEREIALVSVAAAGLTIGAAVVHQKLEDDRLREEAAAKEKAPEKEPSLDVDIRFDELRALDPEASPERIRLILDTLPEGFVEGEVDSIGFVDETYVIDERYGIELHSKSEGAGTASGGTRAERTVITFWKGMKDGRSDEIWNETLLHEVAHANDWDNDHQMSLLERAELKAKVAARVQADDRFRSAYVEAISNPDEQKELEIKAKEYWAEIVAGYLNGTLDPFGPDGTLVAEYIAKNDPEFDRGASLARRKLVTAEMTAEEKVWEYASLPQAEKEAVEAWHAWRSEIMVGGQDLEMQRRGRLEMIEAFKRWGATPEGEKYLYQLVAYHFSVEGVFDARLMADAGLEDSTLWLLGERSAELESARADFPDADLARAEIEDIMKSSGVWIGGTREYGMELQPGEYDRIKSEITSESQKYLFNSWYRPEHERLTDPVREYLDRKAFTMPE